MKVYLIGTGPGDPELLTLKAQRLIGQCTAIVYDDLIPEEVLALRREGAIIRYVGKRAGRDYLPQSDINALLLDLALKGHSVARLKGGDPCIFGRGGEEALFLRGHDIPCEIVPGITSAIAGPESAGIPPTHRGLASSVTFITAHEDPHKKGGFLDWAHLAHSPGTLVFLMGAARIEAIAERLIQEGMPEATPCALIQDATLPRQRHVITTLAQAGRDAAQEAIASPCVIVVGAVATLSPAIYQPDTRPLAGTHVLITRPAHQAGQTCRRFAEQGARVTSYPLVAIAPLDFEPPEPGRYDLFIFTSLNAVELFFDKLASGGRDARCLAGSEIYCIGPKTRAALETRGIIADGMAQEFRAEGIFELLKAHDLTGRRICLPRARGARPYLVEALRARGAVVDEILVYDTVIPEGASAQGLTEALEGVDTVVFTSPSGFRHALELLGGKVAGLKDKRLVAIGPVTGQAMQLAGLSPQVSARVYTDEGIIEALAGIR